MADNGYSDGSVVVSTDLDTKGFEAGSDKMQNAVDSSIDKFNELGDALRDSVDKGVQAVQDGVPLIDNALRDSVSAFETSSDDISNYIDQWTEAMPEKKFETSLSAISKMLDSAENKFAELSKTYNDASEGGEKSISKFEDKASALEMALGKVETKIESLYSASVKTKNGELISGKNSDDLRLLINKYEDLKKVLSSMQTEIIKVKSEMERAKAAEIAAIEKEKAAIDAAKQSTQQLADHNRRDWNAVKQEIKSAEGETKAFDSTYAALDKSMTSLENKMFALGPAAKRAMGGSESAVDSFEFKVANTQRAIQDLRERLEALGNTQVTSVEYDEVNSKLEKARATLNEYVTEQQKMLNSGVSLDSAEWEKITEKINAAKNAVYEYEAQKMRLEYDGATVSGVNTDAYQEIAQRLAQTENEVTRYESKVSRANKTTNALTIALKGIGKVGFNAFKILGKGIAQGISKMRAFRRSSNTSMAAIKKLTKVFTSFGARIKSMLKRRFISSIISGATDGIKNLMQVSPELYSAITSISASLSRLKNSFGTAFAPIITAAAPALIYLIDLLADAFTKVGMLIAALTGATSFKRAVKVQEDYSQALDDTAKSANKASKALAGFDELNNTTSNDVADSGTNTNPASDMFEDVPIDSGIANFAQKLKDLLLGGDYEGLGDLLAQKINGIFQKINKAVDWENVGPAITAFVDGFTRTFNALVDGIDWALIGDTFAKGINTIIYTVYLLATGIDWANLGASLMTGLNSLVYGIDWTMLGVTIGTLFQSSLDFINAVVYTFDYAALATGFGDSINGAFAAINWAMLGDTISTGIKNAFKFVKKLVKTINFKQIGTDVAKALNKIDWAGIFGDLAGMLSSLLAGAFDLLIGFAEELDWNKLGKDVFDSLEAIIKNIDWNRLVSKAFELLGAVFWGSGAFFTGLFDKIYSALQNSWDSVSDYYMDKIAEAGGNIGEGILLGIVEAFLGIGMWVREHIFQPFIDAFCEVFGIASPSTVMATLGGFLIAGLKNGITTAWKSIRSFFITCWNEVKTACINSWNSIKTNASNSWNKIYSTISSSSAKIRDTVSTKFTETKNTVSEKLSIIESDITDGFTNAFNTIYDKTTDIKNTISTKFGDAKQSIATKLTNIKTNISEKFADYYSTIKTKTDDAKNKISTNFTNAATTISTKLTDMKTNISDGFSSMHSTVSSKASEISASISNAFSNAASSAWTWGQDICANIANGIYAAAQWVADAASYIADLIKAYLGFSEPDKGPLSDFHTYMPDMLDLMAEGIYRYKSVAVNAVADLAKGLANEAQDTSILFPIETSNDYAKLFNGFTNGITDAFTDLISRLEAIAGNVTFAVPAVAEGSIIPYRTIQSQNDDYTERRTAALDVQTITDHIDRVTSKLDEVVDAIDNKETGITDSDIYNSVKSSARKEQKSTGRNPFTS